MRKYNQLSLADVFDECQHLFDNDKPSFIKLLEQTIVFADFIPHSFYNAFYQQFGRKREYPLEGFISALLLQKIYSIPTDVLLIIFLNTSKELREFCGFTKVPDASKITRFKQNFISQLSNLFHSLVDYTEPMCKAMDSKLSQTLIYDTSGIEAFVKENNPKYTNTLIRQLKVTYKNKPEVDPYKMAYSLMPSCSNANKAVKQMHINGHFCYVYKFGIITNGLGIVRHIAFLDDDFKTAHPEVVIEKKSDSPDEDKSIGDSTSLQPVLNDFFSKHKALKYKTFLGDAAFDKGDHYTFLKDTCNFNKVLIPINIRNSSVLPTVGYNELGYPLCSNDNSLVMKYSGITGGKGRTPRRKWICPKFKKGVCHCENPCSSAKFGRTAYTYANQDFRLFPGIARNSDDWLALYKNRTVVERTINHLKTNMCVAGRKSNNLSSTKADLLLACIAQLFTVIVADRLKHPELFRSLKPILA